MWKCPLGDTAAYVGAVLVNAKGVRRHYVAVTANGLVGVSTDGKELWRHAKFKGNTANSCTPNLLGNRLFCASNYSRGVVLLELEDDRDGVGVKEVYARQLGTPSWHEMVACVGSHAYVGLNNGVVCLELDTGKTVWEEPRPTKHRPPYSGTYADGHLYLRTQQGVVLLVEATPKEHSIAASFTIPGVKPKAGSTAPVVAAGRLYLRDEERLLCYDVLEGTSPGKPSVHDAPPPSTSKGLPTRTDKEVDAIYVPTPLDVVEKMLEMAKVSRLDLVVDLGCGDGRIVVTAATKFGCRAIGYDLDPECVKLSMESVRNAKVGELVTIERKDFYTADLRKVDVVALYLPPKVTERLLPQLQKLPTGARVVSHAFGLPGIAAERVETVTSKEDGLERKVYLYVAPLKKSK